MFVRVKTTPNSPRKSIQIVENARVLGKIKQKIIRYVGIAMDDREEEKLKTLALEIIAKLKAIYSHWKWEFGYANRSKRINITCLAC